MKSNSSVLYIAENELGVIDVADFIEVDVVPEGFHFDYEVKNDKH